ncbi:DUF2185 domain-containing protein [Chitinophaga nivalis]|uniref:DUF2185 domain-containing protein n=1 Tax=Chitinophaga nivalis TaxID=2991709 RepID=A0ABT3ISC1_9BACT|nr:DUF2185 domain-containing protein [Chitinophaga nivalis]MCW3463685.1 DUF2185 domain-containing protein [Chitinophaga nivalis]MCW3486625.1 DUF2185 domain-containing protein [Chitinophaga nivalis]
MKIKSEDMSNEIQFSIDEIVHLVPVEMGGGIITNKVSIDGMLIKYLYRETPSNEYDSGWRFFAGNETSEYLNDANNCKAYHLNTIANIDPTIIPYLNMPIGTELERVPDSREFREVL